MRGFERISLASLSVCLVVAAAAAAMQSQGRGVPGEWRYYGGNKAFTRYSPLDQINRDNVKNLKIAWRRPAVSDELTQAFPDVRVNNYLRATPIFIDGRLFNILRPYPLLKSRGSQIINTPRSVSSRISRPAPCFNVITACGS